MATRCSTARERVTACTKLSSAGQPIGKFTSEWRRVDGIPIHARVSARPALSSADAPVVLVHGLVISSLYMVPTAERLAPFRRVFAPDLRGFRKSGKPNYTLSIPELADTLRAWMDAVGLERVPFVGNSLGCQILADLAVRYPERVERLVFAGPTMDPQDRRARAQITRWLIDWTREPPSLALAHLRDYYEAGLGRALRTFQYALHDPIEQKLPSIQAPRWWCVDRRIPSYPSDGRNRPRNCCLMLDWSSSPVARTGSTTRLWASSSA